MESEPFKIAADSSDQLIRFALSGVWDLATARTFDQALRSQFETRRRRAVPFDVIADLRAWPVQTQETTVIHEALMAFGRDCGMRNVAVIAGSMLAKMQTMRMAASDRFQAFASEAEAEAWIANRRAAA